MAIENKDIGENVILQQDDIVTEMSIEGLYELICNLKKSVDELKEIIASNPANATKLSKKKSNESLLKRQKEIVFICQQEVSLIFGVDIDFVSTPKILRDDNISDAISYLIYYLRLWEIPASYISKLINISTRIVFKRQSIAKGLNFSSTRNEIQKRYAEIHSELKIKIADRINAIN